MTQEHAHEIVIAATRADMYQLLAAGFLHPDRELAAVLADGSFAADVADTAELLADALDLDDAAARPLLAAAGALAAVGFSQKDAASGDDGAAESAAEPAADPGAETEALYHELAIEYARLFIGPPVPAVSPYETIHVDFEPDSPALLMVSPSARAVLAAYREAGLNMVEGLNEPPDHIATEFEFMHYLCVKEALAGETRESDEAQEWHSIRSRFLREHLAVWGIDFAHKVAASTTNGFYRAIANIAAALLRLEVESDAASPVPSSARA